MNVIKDKQIVVYRNIHAAQKQTPFVLAEQKEKIGTKRRRRGLRGRPPPVAEEGSPRRRSGRNAASESKRCISGTANREEERRSLSM